MALNLENIYWRICLLASLGKYLLTECFAKGVDISDEKT